MHQVCAQLFIEKKFHVLSKILAIFEAIALALALALAYHALTSKLSCRHKAFSAYLLNIIQLYNQYAYQDKLANRNRPRWENKRQRSKENALTSEKYVVTTVLSANLRPARACSAVRAESALSYFTKILPTPFDCRLPPLGRGTFISVTWPYFSHSSLMSSQISLKKKSVSIVAPS